MGVTIGTQLGSYQITALLGRGGMGEVYRARDTKLKRDVAIKILPDEFSCDPDRVARFQREAEVLASLNHPNIAVIHNLEEANGSRFLVLELVEGETLAERIKRGPVPIDEALNIAARICEALEAAHEKGVVHRDLKPANVKITPEGKVKVLDFGLAKAMDNARTSQDISNSPTLSMAGTQAGIILGTAAYMSPEQARGGNADNRSDVFAFGCVLYEMLTGHPAFDGPTVSDVLASVLAKPVDFNKIPPDLHPRFHELLRRCLEKEPKRRWHAIADVRLEIEEVIREPRVLAPETSIVPQRSVWKLAAGLLAAAVLGGALGGVLLWQLKPAPFLTTTRFSFALPKGQRFTRTNRKLMDISPDGSQVVYVANNQLHLRPMSELGSHPIPGTNLDVGNPFFSPDGKWVGFFAASDSTLKKIAVSGGASVTLCKTDSLPFGASWSANDSIVYGNGMRGISRVSSNGGTPEVIVKPEANELLNGPQVLPDGKHILFTSGSATESAGWDTANIVVQSLESGKRKTLIQGGSEARYLPTGHIVYALGTNLLAVPFDVSRLEVTGGPIPIVEGVLRATGGTSGANYAFSSNGSLAYATGEQTDFTLISVTRNGVIQKMTSVPNSYNNAILSPDGRRLAVVIARPQNEIWVYDIARDVATRLTFNGGTDPIWTRDGKRITFRRPGRISWKPADGSGSEETLFESKFAPWPDAWTPDGKMLVIEERRPDTNWDLSLLPIENGKPGKPQPIVNSRTSEGNSKLSPDGKWLAYDSDESGRTEIYVQPFSGPGGKVQVSTDGGRRPIWSRSGQELFYRNDFKIMAVDVQAAPAFAVSKPRMLFEVEARTGNATDFDVTPMVRSLSWSRRPTRTLHPRN